MTLPPPAAERVSLCMSCHAPVGNFGTTEPDGTPHDCAVHVRQQLGIFGRIKRVVVVGCGPAGLAAAHAAIGLGYPVRVLAPKAKTPQRGPLLLQRPIPGINRDHPDGYIRQIVIGGSILDYRYKVYGDVNVNINGNVLADGYHAWRFPETYDKLWDMYEPIIEDHTVSQGELSQRSFGNRGDTLWVSTAQADQFCIDRRAHHFETAEVWVSDKAVYPKQPDDTIIFNADRDVNWVRSSRIFGHEVTEWAGTPWETSDRMWRPGAYKTPGTHRIIKPISTSCDCYPWVLRTGRFGAWRNETWVDTAYYDVRDALLSDQRSDAWTRVLNGVKDREVLGNG